MLGVLVLGLIQTIISFEGTLSSWWTKIFIGLLLFVFILLQRLILNQDTPLTWGRALPERFLEVADSH